MITTYKKNDKSQKHVLSTDWLAEKNVIIIPQYRKISSKIKDNLYNKDSIFYNNNEVFADLINRKYTELSRFDEFINNRKKYLDSLYNLPSNWISGNSEKPNQTVIERAKALLDYFNEFYKNNYVFEPKIIMSPIPIGGFGFEFIIDNLNSMDVSIYNNDTYEIELKKDNYYENFDHKQNDLVSDFLNAYKYLIDG